MTVSELLDQLQTVEADGGGNRTLVFVGEHSQRYTIGTSSHREPTPAIEATLLDRETAFVYLALDR